MSLKNVLKCIHHKTFLENQVNFNQFNHFLQVTGVHKKQAQLPPISGIQLSPEQNPIVDIFLLKKKKFNKCHRKKEGGRKGITVMQKHTHEFLVGTEMN